MEIQLYEHVEQGKTPRKSKLLPGSKRLIVGSECLDSCGGACICKGGQRVPKSGIRVLTESSREVIEDC